MFMHPRCDIREAELGLVVKFRVKKFVRIFLKEKFALFWKKNACYFFSSKTLLSTLESSKNTFRCLYFTSINR